MHRRRILWIGTAASDPFAPVANGRFAGAHFPEWAHKIVALRSDPMGWMPFSGRAAMAP